VERASPAAISLKFGGLESVDRNAPRLSASGRVGVSVYSPIERARGANAFVLALYPYPWTGCIADQTRRAFIQGAATASKPVDPRGPAEKPIPTRNVHKCWPIDIGTAVFFDCLLRDGEFQTIPTGQAPAFSQRFVGWARQTTDKPTLVALRDGWRSSSRAISRRRQALIDTIDESSRSFETWAAKSTYWI
jgi:hypothetical protein